MKIGIVTFVKCDNYGAELQAYAMQYIYNKVGYDAEIIDLEKQNKDISKSLSTIIPAISNRFKIYGAKAPIKVIELIINVIKRKLAYKLNSQEINNKHLRFVNFFNNKIKHSKRYYSLSDIVNVDLPYDILVAGSDQIWNYMHTDYLDIYFLKFSKEGTKKISYAASISVPDIPLHLQNKYKELFENMDHIGVRELNGKDIVEKYSNKKATVVLDPTIMIKKEEWRKNVANELFIDKKYVLIYTLSGSKNIYSLAKNIASKISDSCEVINIKSDFIKEKNNDVKHLYDVGPEEWVGLIMNAAYIVTDSFHGTAFSINFNIPFTTLLNPTSNMNSRAISILKITELENRIIYDNEISSFDYNLQVDYNRVNNIIDEWRLKSWTYIENSIKQ